MRFSMRKPPKHVEESYYAAYASVREDLGIYKHKIVPLTTGAVANHPDLPGNKSPGLPYKLEGFSTKREALSEQETLDRIRKIWYHVEANVPVELADASCFARAHIATRDKNKVRATWGYPLEVYVAEAAYFYPLLDVFKNIDNPIVAYGVEIGNGGMTFVNSMTSAFPSKPILLGDWSGFDQSIPAWLIRDAFKILAEAIDWTKVQDSEGKLWNVRTYRSKRRWRKLIDYFINTTVRLSNGERYQKHSGVPSGSCFTNLIDSIINAIITRYIIYELTGALPLADVYLGDDSVVVLPNLIDLDVFSKFANEQFGMIFNSEKSSQVTDRKLVHFLGYYNNNGTPYKPLDSIIASTIYPERTVQDKVDTISRLVGQAFSCFDPKDATTFLKAATVLVSEENLTYESLNDYIQQHPERFKYLSTLGIDARKIGFPNIRYGVDTWRTLPNINRRSWKLRTYDVDSLYQEGIVIYDPNPMPDNLPLI